MKFVVGLGNPGKKYEGTRHNIGFELLAELSRRFGASRPKRKFDADYSEITPGGERTLLIAPQTFMNCSGRSVQQFVVFFQIPVASLIVVCDDINLPAGKIRLRRSGSSGGQKGLENIIQQLKTPDFARLRIGVDAPPGGMDAADYVLGRYGKREQAAIDRGVGLAAQAVETWVIRGIEVAMNQFNASDLPAADSGSGDRPEAQP